MSDTSRLPPIMRRGRSLSPRRMNRGRTLSGESFTERTSEQRSTGSFRMDESDDDMEHIYTTHNNIQHARYCSLETEEKMKRKLKFHFMNPYEKYKARGKVPWKLGIQIVKVVVVTFQLILFGTFLSGHIDFIEKSTIAFKHLYLKNWDPSYETLPYPPATGVYAIYTIPQFYEHVNYALKQYNETEHLAIGTYHFTQRNDTKVAMLLCKKRYKVGKIFSFNETYIYDSQVLRECFELGPVEVYNETSNRTDLVYDTEKFLSSINRSISFDRIIDIDLQFSVKTIHLKGLSKVDQPDCYQFNIIIKFNNADHNGQMEITLTAVEIPLLDCKGNIYYTNSNENLQRLLLTIFDTIVILVSIISFSLCARSIYRGQKLKKEANKFFINSFGKELSQWDKMEFLDMWYVLIILNDILTVGGSIIKIRIVNKDSFHYDICGMLLGTGNLFVWFGVLRYLGFFEKYNVLILTLKKATPNVLRFLLCAGVFYLGFTFCGWVVLGPYHIKFRSISTASECLFSLVNGDDMFVTFSVLTKSKPYVWLYSRIYLYLFISLFIYIVLSVFISVIMDAYETIKYCYENGFPKSDLMEFIDSCTEDANSPLYRSDTMDESANWFSCRNFLPCCRRTPVIEVTEDTGLIS